MTKFKIDDIVFIKDSDRKKSYRINAVHNYEIRNSDVDTIWMIDDRLYNYTSNSDKVILKPKGVFQWMTYLVKRLLKIE